MISPTPTAARPAYVLGGNRAFSLAPTSPARLAAKPTMRTLTSSIHPRIPRVAILGAKRSSNTSTY
jgi:hypothetical protein